jgi:hypothetical protein
MRKFGWLLYGLSLQAFAASREPSGIGSVAKNLLEPVAYASDFIYTACFVIGGSFVFASLIKYIEHRRNPLAVTLGTVVFLFLAGFFLIALPFAYLIIQNGSPYTLLQ